MEHSMTNPPAPDYIGGDGYDPATGIPSRPIAGNTADDDGQALDQFFQGMPVGPQVYGIPDASVEKLPTTNRIIARNVYLADDQPIMFMSADPRRKHLKIVLYGSGAVQFGSEKSDTYGAPIMKGNGEDAVTSAQLPMVYDFPGYTGAVWLRNRTGGAMQDTDCQVWSITE